MNVVYIRNGQTTAEAVNLAVLAYILAEDYHKRVLLMSLEAEDRLMEQILLGGIADRRKVQYKGSGVEALRKLVKAGMAHSQELESCVVKLGRRLELLPGHCPVNQNSYLRDYKRTLPELLQVLNHEYELVMIWTGKTEEKQFGLLEMDGMKIQNAEQNPWLLKQKIHSSVSGKRGITVFYLFGSYDGNSKYNIHNLRHSCRELNAVNSAVIPDCTEPMDAAADGRLLDWLQEERPAEASQQVMDYLAASRECVETLLRLMERGERKSLVL